MKHFRSSLNETFYNSAINLEAMAIDEERLAQETTSDYWRKRHLHNAKHLHECVEQYRRSSRETEQ